MSLSIRDLQNSKNAKQAAANKNVKLNPNAAEFVPSALRAAPASSSSPVVVRPDFSVNSGKAKLDRVDSNTSNNSDEEAHRYWRHRLPDDITPDFKFMAANEQSESNDISLSGLSLHDEAHLSRLHTSVNGVQVQLTNRTDEIPFHGITETGTNENALFYAPAYVEDPSPAGFMTSTANPWEKQFINGDQHLNNETERFLYNGDPNAELFNEFVSEEVVLDDLTRAHVEFLAKEFPGFAAESLAEVYFANNCDLNSTIEMLAQLEFQTEVVSNQNLSSKTVSAPNLTAMDFPALTLPDNMRNGLPKYGHSELFQDESQYRSNDKDILFFGKPGFPGSSRGATDFAAAVRKLASPKVGQWKYEKGGPADVSVGTSRLSQLRAGSYHSNGRSSHVERFQNHGSARAAPVWLETGDAVGNMYSELREDARDHARIRNAYFEQAKQAYLIGNKALAKELSIKGQLHNLQMKAAHGKARESIFRQRNPPASSPQGYSKGQERMIDLHGLHVNEAIHVLKHELSIVRNTARSASQRLQVYICVGTGHHTKGSRTPARLPIAIERYLIEEEGLEYSEPHPGLLRVVIY